MEVNKEPHICPVRWACILDNKIRRWFQNPKKILQTHIKNGMSVIDFGCGPGYFTVEIADMVGESGKVIAVDVQEGMLELLRNKIKGTKLENRIETINIAEGGIANIKKVDLVLAFYVIHEVENKNKILIEINNMLKDNGLFLVAEPKLFHVSRQEFYAIERDILRNGFEKQMDIKMLFSWAVLYKKVKELGC